jgi:hypothetical protein
MVVVGAALAAKNHSPVRKKHSQIVGAALAAKNYSSVVGAASAAKAFPEIDGSRLKPLLH